MNTTSTVATYTAGRHTGTVVIGTDAWGDTSHRFQVDGGAASFSYDEATVESVMRQAVDAAARADASVRPAAAFDAEVARVESHVQTWDNS